MYRPVHDHITYLDLSCRMDSTNQLLALYFLHLTLVFTFSWKLFICSCLVVKGFVVPSVMSDTFGKEISKKNF